MVAQNMMLSEGTNYD